MTGGSKSRLFFSDNLKSCKGEGNQVAYFLRTLRDAIVQGDDDMKTKLMTFSIILVLIFCFSSCGNNKEPDKEKVSLITWEEEPNTESVLGVCGFNSEGYEVITHSHPDAEREENANGENDDTSKDAQIRATIAKDAEKDKDTCAAIIFQVGSRYHDAIHEFMSENKDVTVFVLSTDGSGVIESQNADDSSESSSDTSAVVEDTSGLAKLRSEPASLQLLRDENNYSLSGNVECVDGIDYSSVGYYDYGDNTLHLYSPVMIDTTDGKKGFFTVGDVPVPILEKDDFVVWYSDATVPTLGLAQVDFYGYGVGVESSEYDGKFTLNIYNPETNEKTHEEDVTNIEVKDSSGNTIDNYYNLQQGEPYTVSWYKGTQKKEQQVKATCKVYTDHTVRKHIAADYKIEGALTDNGYATYDLSGTPAGLYALLNVSSPGRGGIIEIK